MNNTAEAYDQTKKGHIIGYIHFANNFSKSLAHVRDYNIFSDSGSIINRDINICMDDSKLFLSQYMQIMLYNIYQNFSEIFMPTCNFSKKFGSVPIQFSPIFNDFDTSFQHFITPGFILLYVCIFEIDTHM